MRVFKEAALKFLNVTPQSRPGVYDMASRARRRLEQSRREGDYYPFGEDNWFGSVYIGPTNPAVIVDGEEISDYRREPQDEVDAAALRHDLAYDEEDAAGREDALFNRAVRQDDVDLVNSVNQTKEKAASGEIDNVTGQPVTSETARRARWVSWGFTKILNDPKPETPRPQVNTPDIPGRYKYYDLKW